MVPEEEGKEAKGHFSSRAHSEGGLQTGGFVRTLWETGHVAALCLVSTEVKLF